MTDFASEAGRWYDREGQPVATLMGVTTGRPRPVNVRDALKLNLVPSVTTITALAAKPGLDIWKQRQVLLAALTLPRIDGEDVDAFAVRVAADSREQAKKAAERGTAIHAAIEQAVRGEPFSEECRPWVEAVQAALPPMCVWSPERSFAHVLGFGGKVDLFCRECGHVVDFKSKDGDLSDVAVYDENTMQLAAYRVGVGFPEASCANVFISRQEPVVKVVQHKPADLERGWRMFCHLLGFWHATHGREWMQAEAVQAAMEAR